MIRPDQPELAELTLKERIDALAEQSVELGREERELEKNWYALCFELAEQIPIEQLGREFPYSQLIPPHVESSMGGYYTVNWFGSQFHSERNAQVNLEADEQRATRNITIGLRSPNFSYRVANLFLIEEASSEAGIPINSYKMMVEKTNRYRVSGNPQNFDEFDDITNVTELGLLKFASRMIQGYSEQVQKSQTGTEVTSSSE